MTRPLSGLPLKLLLAISTSLARGLQPSNAAVAQAAGTTTATVAVTISAMKRGGYLTTYGRGLGRSITVLRGPAGELLAAPIEGPSQADKSKPDIATPIYGRGPRRRLRWAPGEMEAVVRAWLANFTARRCPPRWAFGVAPNRNFEPGL